MSKQIEKLEKIKSEVLDSEFKQAIQDKINKLSNKNTINK